MFARLARRCNLLNLDVMKGWSVTLLFFLTVGFCTAIWLRQLALLESRSVDVSPDRNSNRTLVSSTAPTPSKEQEAEHAELLRLRNQVALLQVATSELAAELGAATNALVSYVSAQSAQSAELRRMRQMLGKLQAEADARSDRPASPYRVGAWIGAGMQDATEFAPALGVEKGVLIPGVSRVGPAGRAGLKEGDVIVKADGHDIANPRELRAFLAQKSVGQVLTLDVVRDGKPISVEVTPRERPN